MTQRELNRAAESTDDRINSQTSVLDVELRKYPAAHWAQFKHINTRGEDMDFTDLPYLLSLYRLIDKTPRMVVEKSVQCGLSELFIVQSHLEAGYRGMNVMYVLPKYELRNRFVNNRIYKLHKRVPAYDLLLKAAEASVHRTSLVHFGRGTLSYVGSNVESEFLEIPIDSAYVDEKDRCNTSNLLLLPDRYSASPYRYHREISNPTVEGFGIDERYQESSKGVWKIQCEHCGKWFTPDFWEHIVRQIDDTVYIPRDPDYELGTLGHARLIHDCGKPTNRLATGTWVHEHPTRLWKGFRISKLFSKFANIAEEIEKWIGSVGNATKEQVFYNSDLGLPFTSEGAKITRAMLEKCKRSYRWPVAQVDPENIRIMGVDVGSVLHVIIRERIRTLVGYDWRLVIAQTVDDFAELAKLLRTWQPRLAVIDAQPELHKVKEMKKEFKNMWSSRFQIGLLEPTLDKRKRIISMDRTSILDSVQEGFNNEDLLLPMQADTLDGGNYYAYLMSSTRVLEIDEKDPDKARFVWVHTKPDHYFLAEGYCKQAEILMPNVDVFDFMRDESENSRRRTARKVIKSGDTIEEKETIQDLQKLTPEVTLANIQKTYNEPKKVAPTVDDEEIWAMCEEQIRMNGYVDLYRVVEMTGEHEDDVKRVLKAHLYSESKIKGQYVR